MIIIKNFVNIHLKMFLLYNKKNKKKKKKKKKIY